MRSLLILVAVFLAVPASVYAADDLSMSVTNTLNLDMIEDQLGDADEFSRYGFVANKLNTIGRYGDLSFWLRLDTHGFAGLNWEEDSESPYGNEVYPRRAQLRYKVSGWKVTGGDFYKEGGRGIALSLRKGDEVSADTSLFGADVTYSSGNQGFSVFGGVTNQASLDPVERYATNWKPDQVAGANYELRSLGSFKLGAHGIYFKRSASDQTSGENYESMTGGLTVEAIEVTEWLSFYTEFNVQQLENLSSVGFGGVDDLGGQNYAGYFTADLTFGDTLILAEGLLLDSWELYGSQNTGSSYDAASYDSFDYSRPPTMQRLQDEVADKSNVMGGRLRVEQYIEDYDLTLYANGLYRLNKEEPADQLTEIHGFVGFELNYDDGSSRIKAESGYRTEDYVSEEIAAVQGGKNIKNMIHGYVDWVHALGGGYSLQVNSDTEYRDQTSKQYFKGQTAVGIAKSGLGDVAAEIGYDDGKQYYAGLVTWKISGGWHLKAVAGSRRGGLKCINGMCRIYPEYRGASLELVSRF